ncbi:uncharacterized protein A4U43_C01F9720 [Asparagus officinalis]|uniref:Pentacotripeptide-repeat region of PRORP domain-containing protein n=1 Tax=Asparagus officinalis TaxID=4686 RepID=A0A5P1FPV9_ASPOF|nr:pentatricopeptide repeat-containing protein At4g33170-like [Asparagus officinalis]ONK79753.1 uncharacterized protein A4U43_C01F9720 [Asparagus officinalis]
MLSSSSPSIPKFLLRSFPPSTLSQALETQIETFAHRLQTCARSSNLLIGATIHAHLLKLPLLSSSLFLQNHLLNMYFKCSPNLSQPLQLFDEMPQRNLVSWSASIAGLVQAHHPYAAISLFIRMYQSGLWPNEFTLVSALHASSLIDDLNCARHVFAQVVKLGFESNVFLCNAFLMGLIRNRRLEDAVEFFEKCGVKDVVSWNSMIAGFLELDCLRVWGFWCRMMREGVDPDEYSFSSVLTGLAIASSSLVSGTLVHAQILKCGFMEDICVGNSLVDMYLKNRNLDCGFRAFDEMTLRDVVSWTQMAAGCLDCGQPTKALDIVTRMKLVGIMPNKFTMATALNACSNLASIEEGRKAHGFRVKLGNDVDVCVDNALIDMYAKCGSMEEATKVFREMKERCNVSWTTLIKGSAENGLIQESLDVFDQMISEQVEPNHITFICILYACSQGGFIDEGWRYFKSMKDDFGIDPGEDHYACMVDLLGKAGEIEEAESLILSMPFRAGVLVWQTLLAACKVHGDVETGKRAAEKALALENNDPSTYVLLSNIYADKRNWDGVDRVRELMGDREVKKTPGSSWIRDLKG